MASKTIVHVMRHGEVHNPNGILYGRLDGFELSYRGRQQAQLVAGHLADRDIVHIACSPLTRARQTAESVASHHGLTPVVDDRLIEADNRFEGKKVGFADVAWRDVSGWLRLYNPLRPSWSEAFAAIAGRMAAALEHARTAAVGHEAVCVSHQLPIWMLRRLHEGRPLWHNPRRRQCSLASLTSFEFTGDRLSGLHYSDPTQDLTKRSVEA
jgi:broad specificity phosphatase PhoE